MKTIKKLFALCLVVTLIFGALPAASAAKAGYPDVPESHWAHDLIGQWTQYGIVEGDQNGNFNPDESLDLGSLAAMLTRVFGYTNRVDCEVTPTWADVYVEQTMAAGVLERADSIDAGVVVTREQALRYIAIAYGVAPIEGETTFSDDADISEDCKPYVNALQQMGALQGIGENRLSPKSSYDRASALQVFARLGLPEKDGTQIDGSLKAGMGASPILFESAMFPVEGFSGEIHTNPYARVLVMEQGSKAAIVSLELVNVPSDVIDDIKEIVSAQTGTPESNIWVHANHTITTPHAPSDEAQRALYVKSVEAAVAVAAAQAADTFQPAVLGVGTGESYVNVNRNYEFAEGIYGIGPNGGDLPSNHEMTVVRFENLDGELIGMFFSHGTKPAALESAGMADGVRQISSDVTGMACAALETKYGAPVMFCMSATGDQNPRETVYYGELNEEGTKVSNVDGGAEAVEAGIQIVETLGAEMAEDAASIADAIICTDADRTVRVGDTTFTCKDINGENDMTIDVRGITIGDDLALVGFKPEVNAVTERQIWEASSAEHTLLMAFVDGDSKYMPDDSAYDLHTWEYSRTGMERGAAEMLVSTAVNLIGDIESATGLQSGTSSSDINLQNAERVTLGGVEWLVLTREDDKMLVISLNVLEKRPYHAVGGAITWEDCDLRAYLNGEFYDTFFSDEEKARIVEVTNENPSNPTYGITGGNATVDKVFLLSLQEAGKYMGSGTDVLRAVDSDGNAVWWHLRSPGEATDVNAGVDTIGLIDAHGTVEGVSNVNGGVRPAMWIKAD